MTEPNDANVTADNPTAPGDSPDTGLTAGFARPADPLGTSDPGPANTLDYRSAVPSGADASAGALPAVPGYRVLREIARGGMGCILAAHDLTLDREIALKVLLPGANPDRFIRESKITARLPHPGIPPVHALGTLADGFPFLAMKLIAGQTLADELKTADRPRLLQAFTQVCQAVGFAHSRGVIHRDLKPANIMVGAFGEVQVMDWGLAKDVARRDFADQPDSLEAPPVPIVSTDASQTIAYRVPGEAPDDRTQAGAIMGTPAYMAPEQARGEAADARADVFALGGILCKILTGQPPFRGRSSLEVIQRAGAADLAEALARLDGCGADAELVALCRRCLSPSPMDRPADGQAVADGLAVYLNGVQVRLQAAEREQAVAVARETEQRKLRRVQLTLAAAALLVLVGGIVVSVYFAIEANRQAQEAVDQKKIAEKNADDAIAAAGREAKQKNLADENAKNALHQKGVAEMRERDARLAQQKAEFGAYASRLREAQIEIDRGRLAEAQAILQQSTSSLRGWEHDYLLRQTQKCRWTGGKHTGGVSSVAFSSDGQCVVSGSWDKTVKVWDAVTGQVTLTLRGHTLPVSTVAFSSDGQRIVSGSWDKTVKLWDASTGLETLTLKGHTDRVNSVAFSSDGQRIVSGSGDKTVKVWDGSTGLETLTLRGHTLPVTSVGFSSDGKRIVSGSFDKTVKVWDAGTGQVTLTLRGHTQLVSSVAFSSDGRRIVSGSYDLTVKVWDAGTGLETLTLRGHTQPVQSVAFSSDGKRIVSGSYDKTVSVWDAGTGQETLALRGHTLEVYSVAFSSDGKRIVSGSYDKTLKVWDAGTGQEALTLQGHMSIVSSVAISSAGQRIVSGSFDNTLKVWDAGTGRVTLTLQGHTSTVSSVAFSSDGRRIVSGSQDATVKVWDAGTGQVTLTLRGHTSAVSSVVFSSDGQRIVSGSQDGTVKVWDAGTGQVTLTLRGHTANVRSVAMSSDGKRIVSGSSDRTVKVWDASTGQETLTLRGHTQLVSSVAFSSDGKRIVSGSFDLTVKVWDAGTGLEALTLRGHTLPVHSVAFSSDGKRIVSGSSDRTVKVWDTSTGQEALTFKGHTGDVWSVAFSSDGKRIVSGSGDRMLFGPGEVKVWNSSPGEEQTRAEKFAAEEQTRAKRFAALLRGEDKPADNAERLTFALIAFDQKKFALATRLWAEALASDPKLGADRQTQHRYNAARAAALAAAGQGQDEPPLDDLAKAKLRRQALDWLKAERTAWGKLLESGPPQNRPFIVRTLSHWQKDSDLAGLRDAEALAKLPAVEGAALTQLWADVAELLKKAEEKPK